MINFRKNIVSLSKISLKDKKISNSSILFFEDFIFRFSKFLTIKANEKRIIKDKEKITSIEIKNSIKDTFPNHLQKLVLKFCLNVIQNYHNNSLGVIQREIVERCGLVINPRIIKNKIMKEIYSKQTTDSTILLSSCIEMIIVKTFEILSSLSFIDFSDIRVMFFQRDKVSHLPDDEFVYIFLRNLNTHSQNLNFSKTKVNLTYKINDDILNFKILNEELIYNIIQNFDSKIKLDREALIVLNDFAEHKIFKKLKQVCLIIQNEKRNRAYTKDFVLACKLSGL